MGSGPAGQTAAFSPAPSAYGMLPTPATHWSMGTGFSWPGWHPDHRIRGASRQHLVAADVHDTLRRAEACPVSHTGLPRPTVAGVLGGWTEDS